ncbi:MAG: hypothetical protein ACR2QM_05070 [Longimicrobiales bacterium]
MTIPRVGLALTFLLLGCADPGLPMPDAFVGIWSTDHEGYSDRAFEVTEEILYIQTGDVSYNAHSIEAVRPGASQRSYLIEYTVEDAVAVFDLTVGSDHIYMTKQPEVEWTRWEEPSVPWRP